MGGGWTFYAADGARKTVGEQGPQGEQGPEGDPGSGGVVESALLWTSRYRFGIGVARRIYVPHAVTITEVRLFSQDAAPSSTVTVDLLKNGVSILDSPATLATGSFLGNAATIDDPDVAVNDYLQFEVINAGSLSGPINGRIKLEY